MTAIILASGTGSRLKPLTDALPKGLISLTAEKTIIDRIIDSLRGQGIQKIVVTTGFEDRKLSQHIAHNFSDLDIQYCMNDQFESTGYIYSLWLTKDFVEDDILLLHADLVFENALLNKLILSQAKNAVLIKNKQSHIVKDFKARVRDGKVVEINVDLKGENVFDSMPIYKFCREDFRRWMNQIEQFINNKKVNCYAEEALNLVLPKLELFPEFFEDELCMEIDTLEDLKEAKEQIARL